MSAALTNGDRLRGSATPAGTLRYAARFQGRAAAGHFRQAAGELVVSSIGLGTYLGEPDAATDRSYTEAVMTAVEGGINFIDSAINYRFQRSERSIGRALGLLAFKGFSRDEMVLSTKGGFLTPDGTMPDDVEAYFSREFMERGIFRPDEIVAGCHCLAPRYLADQLDRSLANLGVESVDVFYLHNPETQLTEIPVEEFRHRIAEAFRFLEQAVAANKIGAYGLATWNSFREDPKAKEYLSLAWIEQLAREAAGPDHHFRFLQLPLNLAMPEALVRPNQVVAGKTMAIVQAARALGITLVTSAALLQGQLTRNLPAYIGRTLGLPTPSAQALQFARSVPGVTTALVGMSRVEHVRQNLELIGTEPAPRDQFLELFKPQQ
jgi:aryl-alcohol dehydrogenase-like predicted oxidoreductase